jgi:hypothetical protein
MAFLCWERNLGNVYTEPLPSNGHMHHNTFYTRMAVANPGSHSRLFWKTTPWSASNNNSILFLSFTLRRMRESAVLRLVERWLCPLPWTGSGKCKRRCGAQSVLALSWIQRKHWSLHWRRRESIFHSHFFLRKERGLMISPSCLSTSMCPVREPVIRFSRNLGWTLCRWRPS